MADSDEKEPIADSWLKSLKNRPAIAVLLLLAAIVTGLASFTESIDKLLKFFAVEPDRVEVATKSEQDVRLEQVILGTWKPSSMPPSPTGFVVSDFNFTFLRGGIVNWGGSYSYQDNSFPIMMSGKWRIDDSVLHYEVKSSNVPLVMKEGFSSVTKINDISNNKMTYIDSVDRQAKVAFRIE